MEDLKRDHPEVDPSNIKIDVPVAGPAQPRPNLNQPQPPVNLAWGRALPNYGAVPAYGAGPAADMGGVQAFRRQAEERMLEQARQRVLLEERHHARFRLEQAVWRERAMANLERAGRDMFMAMPMPQLPPMPPLPP